jgi:hypothetical protein
VPEHLRARGTKEHEGVRITMVCTKCGSPCPVYADFQDPNVDFNSSVLMRFDEPQQGKFADCWFVAALSSYLFVNWPPAPVNFSFYNGKKWISIATSGNVCVKQNDIYGAKEIDNNGVTYSWPAVYEKAFAAFNEKPSNPPDPPDMKKYIDRIGSPLDCLEIISGSNRKGFLTSSFAADDIFSTIQDKTRPETGESSSVSFPFVAWTTAGKPGLGIKNDHSFSILGVFQSGDSKFIILRDPDVADCQAYGQNVTWTYYDKQTYLPTPVNCSINNGKGIFAITPANFKASFYGYGYVQ